MDKKTTVGEMLEILNKLDKNLEIVVYPKYRSGEVNGFTEFSFAPENVGIQEPYALTIKKDTQKLKEYFGGRTEYEDHEINTHVAIIF